VEASLRQGLVLIGAPRRLRGANTDQKPKSRCSPAEHFDALFVGHCQLESCGSSANHISLIRHTRPGESRRRTGENRPRIAQVDSAVRSAVDETGVTAHPGIYRVAFEVTAPSSRGRIRPPWWLRVFNTVFIRMSRLGMTFGGNGPVVLTVQGRKSGKPRSTPVTPMTVDGKRYVV
jgi:F420H(2)-dependent quinone reductase